MQTAIRLHGSETIEVFRRSVLKALDKTSADLFDTKHGWTDADLPALFRVIDSHVVLLAQRKGVELTDD